MTVLALVIASVEIIGLIVVLIVIRMNIAIVIVIIMVAVIALAGLDLPTLLRTLILKPQLADS